MNILDSLTVLHQLGTNQSGFESSGREKCCRNVCKTPGLVSSIMCLIVRVLRVFLGCLFLYATNTIKKNVEVFTEV